MCFDKKNAEIVAENGNVIRSLSLSDESGIICRIEKKSGLKGKNRLSLQIPDTLTYFYFESWKDTPIKVSDLIKPNKEYVFSNHTFGDAAAFEIRIKTDREGKIVFCDRECD